MGYDTGGVKNGYESGAGVGGQVLNMLNSTTQHVGCMILKGITSLPRYLCECTALICTPRVRLTPRCIGTLPIPPLIHHMKVHRHTRTSNNNSSSSMVDMLVHSKHRQFVHMGC